MQTYKLTSCKNIGTPTDIIRHAQIEMQKEICATGCQTANHVKEDFLIESLVRWEGVNPFTKL